MGVFSSPSIPLDGLVFSIDAGNTKSYSGSGTNVNDVVNGINGTLINGTTFNSILNGSFYFDGVNDQIVSGNFYQYIVSTNNNHSMFAWINPLVNSGIVINWGEYADSQNATSIAISNGYLSWAQNGNSTDAANTISTFLVPLNIWSFVGFVRTSSDVTIYYNNSSLSYSPTYAPTGAGIAPSNNPFTIGRGSTNGNARSFFSGFISNVQIYNRALSASEVLQLYNASKDRYSYKADIIKNGLLLNYDISSNLSYTSPNTYIQSTINDYPGLVVNGPTFSSNNGGYLNFDGVNDHIRVYNSPFGFTTESFTYSYWIYINSFTTNLANQGPIPYYKGDFQINGYYSQIVADGSYFFGTNQPGAMQATTTAPATLTTGAWYYISDVRNGSSVRIYVNGIDRTNIAGTHINPSYSNSDLYIASYKTSIFGNIRIGHFKVYNRALSSTEILSNFNALRGRFGI